MAYKDKNNGKWIAQWYTEDVYGKKVLKKKRGFRTLREARAYEENQHLVQQKSLNIDLESFSGIYFEDKRNELKERTIKNKRYLMERHIFPFFEQKKMDEITPSDIVRWQNAISDQGYSESYLRMIQNQLTALFSHASKIYDLKTNPCKKVRRMGKNKTRELEFWTLEEYEQFIQTVPKNDKYFYIFELLYWTGMRVGELLALAKKDFDFDKNIVSITKTYYRTNMRDIITQPKTEESTRVIPIPAFLSEEIQSYIGRLYGLPNDARLFPIVQEAVQHKMKTVMKKSGVRRIRVHDLRHSHVSYLIDQGVDPLIIKERLGHRDIKITLNTYGHLYPSRQKEVADMLDENRQNRSQNTDFPEKRNQEVSDDA